MKSHFRLPPSLLPVCLLLLAVPRLRAQQAYVTVVGQWTEDNWICSGSGSDVIPGSNEGGIIQMAPYVESCTDYPTTYETINTEVDGMNPSCSYDIVVFYSDGSMWDQGVVSGQSSWSDSNTYCIDTDSYPVDVEANPVGCPPTIVSIAPNCSWFQQGGPLNLSQFTVVTSPAGQGGASNISLLQTTVNATSLSNGTPTDPGGLGTMTVTATDGTNQVSCTINVYDPTRQISADFLTVNGDLIKTLSGIESPATQVGLSWPSLQWSSTVTAVESYRVCNCNLQLLMNSIQGSASLIINPVTITSPTFPVCPDLGISAQFQIGLTGSITATPVTVSTTCDNLEYCVAGSGQVGLAVTGALCEINCNIASISATGTAQLSASGTYCSMSGWTPNATRGSFIVTGAVTFLDHTFVTYSYPVW